MIWTIIFRTVLFYFLVVIAYKIMGKREVGELGVFDFIISMLISQLIAICIENYKDPIWFVIVPTLILVLFQIVFSFLSLKSNKFRDILDGKESVIISNGKLNFSEMKKQKYNLNDFKEVVFCGFGEPLIRHDDLMKVAKYLKERRPDLPTRVNTNGLSSLYNKRDITPEFKGLLDTVSISLNTSNKEDYLKLTRSQYGIDSFDELLDFAKKCKAYVPHVVLTIVDTTIPEKDVEICKQIAQNIGVTLRIRPFED